MLWEWKRTSLTEVAELVVSELMTNSVTATKAIDSLCPVKLWLLSDKSQTLILVADASPHPPKRIDPETSTEAGRGLLLVEAITSDWGWYPVHRNGMAKVVWAILENNTVSRIPPAAGT